jgi:hypothetical protein
VADQQSAIDQAIREAAAEAKIALIDMTTSERVKLDFRAPFRYRPESA